MTFKNFILDEGLLSEMDFYYNYDDWINNKSHILFIAGYSGSGKSTIGQKLAIQFKSEYIPLDQFFSDDKQKLLWDKFTQENKEEIEKFLKNEIKGVANSIFKKFMDYRIDF